MRPKSFRTPEDFRDWLEKHHAGKQELIVRLFRTSARHRGLGYKEALDEALCFGWIDGVRRSLDEHSFTQRFTPRQARSNWSAININRAGELVAEGRMRPAGLAAFERRDRNASAPYTYERRDLELDPVFTRALRANKIAWDYFQSRPPGYRGTASRWVMLAKRHGTRVRRFQTLLECSAKRTTIPPLTRPTVEEEVRRTRLTKGGSK